MRLLYSRIYKNYQVNVGAPFQVKLPPHIKYVPNPAHVPAQDEVDNPDADREDPEEILRKAKEEADLLLREAQLETERLMKEAQDELAMMKEAVREEAHREGYEEGKLEARKEYEDMLQEADSIRQHAKIEYEKVLAGIEADAMELILDISRKVIGMEIVSNKEALVEMVKLAFEKCSEREHVVVRVCPEDAAFLEANPDKLLASGLGDYEIKKDPLLKPGDCILETTFGSTDAGVGTKLSKIEEAFRQVMKRQI